MPIPAAEKPRYYHKGGKLYDNGVEFSEGEARRILKEYPQKIANNEKTAAALPAAAKVSAFANETLNRDMREIQQALVDRDTAKTIKLKGTP